MANSNSGAVTLMCNLLLFMYMSGFIRAEYIITHTPRHTQFRADGGLIDLSEIPKVVLSSFGYETNNDLKWKGLSQGSLFNRPKAQAIISVEGVSDGLLKIKDATKYDLNNDIGTVNTEPVRNVLHGSLFIDFNAYPRVYDIRYEDPVLFKNIPSTFTGLRAIFTQGQSGIDISDLGSLNFTHKEDATFLEEIYILRSIVEALLSNPKEERNPHPDFYHLKVSGMKDLIRAYGKDAPQVQDALRLLQKTIMQMTSCFRKVYRENVVVQVVTYVNDEGHVRKVRSLMADQANTETSLSFQDEINVAVVYNENYGVMFNFILWFTVAMIVTLLFVSYGMWFMDPGRDSIIYRMTTQRLKRE